MPLTATRPEVYIDTITIFISYLYGYLEENINRFKSIKLNIYPLYNVAYFCDETLVDVDLLENSGDFKSEHLGYINQILRILMTTYFFLI